MSKITKSKGVTTATVLASLAGILALLVILVPKLELAENGRATGSVTQGNEYFASTTKNYMGTSMPNLSVLKVGSGSLGSVVITGAAAGVINIYDATSTVTNTEWATTTLATFPASTAAGTYTFDATFKKGLLVEILTATPTSTITWR